MLTEIYNWLFELFFSGELPAVLAPVATECCALLSLVFLAFVLIIPLWFMYYLMRVIFNFGRF